jgi:3-hydroxyacyl-[acyl-carrier-protein] dehydratase
MSAPADDDARLREALKRCSPSTLDAARAFRATGDYAQLPVIVTGVIERFVERELRAKLTSPSAELRLIEDLGLDSLTMMEIVILTEDVLPVTINNDELRHLRTLGNVTEFIECKLRGLPLPPALLAQTNSACNALTTPPMTREPSVIRN